MLLNWCFVRKKKFQSNATYAISYGELTDNLCNCAVAFWSKKHIVSLKPPNINMIKWFCNLNIISSKLQITIEELINCTHWLSNCCQATVVAVLSGRLFGSSTPSSHLDKSHRWQPSTFSLKMIDIACTFANMLRVWAVYYVSANGDSYAFAILSAHPGCSKMEPLCRIFPRLGKEAAEVNPYLTCTTYQPTQPSSTPLPPRLQLFCSHCQTISWVTRSCLFQRPSCSAHHGWPPACNPLTLFTWHVLTGSSKLNWVLIESWFK